MGGSRRQRAPPVQHHHGGPAGGCAARIDAPHGRAAPTAEAVFPLRGKGAVPLRQACIVPGRERAAAGMRGKPACWLEQAAHLALGDGGEEGALPGAEDREAASQPCAAGQERRVRSCCACENGCGCHACRSRACGGSGGGGDHLAPTCNQGFAHGLLALLKHMQSRSGGVQPAIARAWGRSLNPWDTCHLFSHGCSSTAASNRSKCHQCNRTDCMAAQSFTRNCRRG